MEMQCYTGVVLDGNMLNNDGAFLELSLVPSKRCAKLERTYKLNCAVIFG
jgi:hypothetical protein